MNKFSAGKQLAFFCGLIATLFAWAIVFVPGGLGSNIILGMFAAVWAIYWLTTHFGNYLDVHLFNKGSKERAAALLEAQRILGDTKIQLRASRSITTAGQLNPILVQLEALQSSVREISANLTNNQSAIQSQITRLNDGITKVRKAMGDTFGKRKQSDGWLSLFFALSAALALRAFVVEPYQIPSGSMIPTLEVGDHLFVSKLSYGIVNPFSSIASYFIRWETPKPGDVIVFEAPSYVGHHAGQAWIKRVIAGPGQSISIRDAVVYVDKKPYPHITADEMVSYMNYVSDGRDGFWQENMANQSTEKINDIIHRIFTYPPIYRYAAENSWPRTQANKFPGLICDYSKCTVKEGFLFVMGDNRSGSKDSRYWGALPIEMVKGRALFVWMSVDGSRNLISWGKFAIPAFRFNRWFTEIS